MTQVEQNILTLNEREREREREKESKSMQMFSFNGNESICSTHFINNFEINISITIVGPFLAYP